MIDFKKRINLKWVFAAALLALFIFGGCIRIKSAGPVSLTMYGLDDSDVFEPLIAKYRESRANVKIKYKKFDNPAEFENLLVNEIAEGEGPDILYVKNTWLPRHAKKLIPFVSDKFTPQNFFDAFVKVAGDDFIQPDPRDGNRKIYAVPLYIDTLALYYNKDHFEKKIPERGKPAASWEVLKQDAGILREQGTDGRLARGGVALGRADNITLAPDILMNFFLQAGVEFYDDGFMSAKFAGKGGEMFEYFASYGIPQNKNYSWSADLVSSEFPLHEVEAFLAGRVSTIFGYSDLYQRLKNDLKNVESRNPGAISFSSVAVAPSPQMNSDAAGFKVWADYYGLAVNRNSKNPAEAWDFIQFLGSKENSRAYHAKTKRPTARRDLIEEQRKEPMTDVFVSQLGYAGSFRIFDEQRFSEIFRVAIQSAVSGQTGRQALSQAQEKINKILETEAPEGLYPKPKKK